MKTSLLELDPDADALLILQRPNLQQLRPYVPDLFVMREEVQENEETEPTTTASPATERLQKDLDEIRSLQPEQKDGTANEIVFRVSAKHLSMTSPIFRMMVKGDFRESQPNDQGLLEIRTSEWNAEALMILLDIIHGHHKHVPKAPDQDIVAHIGLIADYYHCTDIVQVFYHSWETKFSDSWDESWPYVDSQTLSPFGKQQELQIFIAWTFQSDQVFSYLATNAILTASGPIETYLPLPKRVTDHIDQRRTGLLQQLFKKMYNRQKDLLEQQVGCSQDFSCRLAGHLMRQMWERGLPLAKPEWPFSGYSVMAVAESIRGIETPSWRHHKSIRILDCCKLDEHLHFDFENLCDRESKLTLKDVEMSNESGSEDSCS